jgi:pyruvate carboxylase
MAGVTSQPALNSIVAALEYTDRDTGIERDGIQIISDYWDGVRPVYYKFESELKSGTADVYKYEIPGGQYSNLKSQVDSFGLGHKFYEVKEMYKTVNDMVGDIVKVTPSSKMVGDLAIFMIKNDLMPENIIEKAKNMAFPDSVVSYYEGMMGQPVGGFSKDLQDIVLKGKPAITCRPGELLPPVDFEKLKNELIDKFNINPDMRDILSYALYPKVFEEYTTFIKQYGDISRMNSHVFFEGLRIGVPVDVELDEGNIFIVELVAIGKLNADGYRRVVFEINGNRRELIILDKTYKSEKAVSETTQFADPGNTKEIGAGIPGNISKILVKQGQSIKKGDSLLVIEAMKMETNIIATSAGVVSAIYVKEKQKVKTGELLIKLE